jgi:hypothetical protein
MNEPNPNSTSLGTGSITNGVIRGAMAATGGATTVAAHDDLIQLIGALVTVLSIVWSIVEKMQARKNVPPTGPTPGALSLLALFTGATLFAGCASLGLGNLTTQQKLNLWQTVAAESAYVGASYDLAAAPAHRARYVVVVAALDSLVEHENYTPGALRDALAGLPGLNLTGSQGALLDAGATLYIVATGFIAIDSAPAAKAVLLGTRAGLQRALARPTGPATRALAAPLPVPCVVPLRPAAQATK